MSRRLQKEKCALIIVDIQERLIRHVERANELLGAVEQVVSGCKHLGVPIFVSEQYPEKMGPTVSALDDVLNAEIPVFSKTTFSCLGEPSIVKALENSGVTHWILVGIEAHVCILQTAKDLLDKGHDVVVLNDAISSRSIYDYSTAIAEMRDEGVRISSVETVLFELLYDAKVPEFKQVSQLIKS